MSAKVILKKKLQNFVGLRDETTCRLIKNLVISFMGKNANPLSIREVRCNVLFVSVLPFFETASRFLKKNQLIFKYH